MQPPSISRRLRNAGLIVFLLATSACAKLPPTSAVAIPPLRPDLARVWFYRIDAPHITQARPYVRMNGAIVGISEDGGAFYRDVQPGEYYVTADSIGVDINQFPHIALVPGQTAYLQVFGSNSWESGGGGGGNRGGADWARPTFYVWLMPNDIGDPAVARSPFYASDANFRDNQMAAAKDTDGPGQSR
jgi:hypothetical protein